MKFDKDFISFSKTAFYTICYKVKKEKKWLVFFDKTGGFRISGKKSKRNGSEYPQVQIK